ncbi:class I SAM-dependent methyltransferase [Desulfatitalea tepidiphila]|uniref:class I SAM-dependent methyltransferase n=1 Tax=Desulfatitalea tepidiphila TaxID=1185843 RepID=UPI00128FA73A|nr:class I SAM-dependent methyltransferase [Desulfatitalea tepidiphila]
MFNIQLIRKGGMRPMGYVFDFQDAREYEQWATLEHNRRAARLEHQLMFDLLQPSPNESVLDIGCGSGLSTRPLVEMGLNVTGVDPSPYMLDLCFAALQNRVELYRGYAEDLPFGDNSFNYAIFFIALEFADDPMKAIEEACRVAKDKVFFGLLNRFAINGTQRWRGPGVFSQVRFFSPWKLKKMIRSVAGNVPVVWRTACQFPYHTTRMMEHFERSAILQRCPFGAFAGVTATLVPRFRTRPLAIRYRPKKVPRVMTGSAPVGPATSDHSCMGRCRRHGRSGGPEPGSRHESLSV